MLIASLRQNFIMLPHYSSKQTQQCLCRQILQTPQLPLDSFAARIRDQKAIISGSCATTPSNIPTTLETLLFHGTCQCCLQTVYPALRLLCTLSETRSHQRTPFWFIFWLPLTCLLLQPCALSSFILKRFPERKKARKH